MKVLPTKKYPNVTSDPFISNMKKKNTLIIHYPTGKNATKSISRTYFQIFLNKHILKSNMK